MFGFIPDIQFMDLRNKSEDDLVEGYEDDGGFKNPLTLFEMIVNRPRLGAYRCHFSARN